METLSTTKVSMNRCLAITNNITRCKRITNKEYCHCHFYGHGVYKNEDGWPTMLSIKRLVPQNIKNINELTRFFINIRERYLINPITTNVYLHRQFTILSAEIFLMYRHLHFEAEGNWQTLIKILIDKINCIEHLEIYREHLRKRLEKGYRREAQMKYIIFFFKGIVGSDLSKYIANFM